MDNGDTTEGQAPLAALAFLGPTASGKSAAAMALAEAIGQGPRGQGAAEIICCDSVQIYRGMDIGSAKPSREEQRQVRHHLLDLVDPNEQFHAGAWARAARPAIRDIHQRGGVPIIVGGTGLYFRALVQGLFEAPKSDPAIRQRHKAESDAKGVPALHARLHEIDPIAAARVSCNDLVRISRALEVFEQTGKTITQHWADTPAPMALNLFCVSLDPPPEALRVRIADRVDEMLQQGLVTEVEALFAAGFGSCRSLGALGYREISMHLRGEITEDEAVALIKKNTVAFAKRQRTWFRKRSEAESRATYVSLSTPRALQEVFNPMRAWCEAQPGPFSDDLTRRLGADVFRG